MEFNILGPLEILPRGEPTDLRRAKERCLLALLLVTPNRLHRTEILIYQVWDDDDPPDAVERTFRSYMSHVRNAIGGSRGDVQLQAKPGGYLLKIDQDLIDLHRFRRLRDQAIAIAQSGDTVQAVALLREADRLWRGPALVGLPGRWIAGMRHGLEEERRYARLRRFGLELDLGRHAELTVELQQLAAQFPLDETCIAYRMMALYRSGRQADALNLFQEARDCFLERGLEPGPGLSALQQRILRHDPDLVVTRRRTRSVLRGQVLRSATLPEYTGDFVGREKEIMTLTSEDNPEPSLITIIMGMAGVGKTTLAVEAARRLAGRYPDGQLYIKFHTHEPGELPLDSAEALRRLLDMIGARLSPTPIPRGIRELTALWQDEISARRAVIVLDDVPGLDAVTPVLPRTGNCLTLITTRNRLPDVPGATVLPLDVLPEPDAVALFTKIIGPGKADDPAAIVKAVRLCGHLPLAIKLTAARLRDSEESTISEFIADVAKSHVLPDGLGGGDLRLMQSFELSYKGLTATQQRFFRRLGANPCPDFTAHSAAAVAGTTMLEARSTLMELSDRHLVENAAHQRFRFHDLLRAYAAFCSERDEPGRERRNAQRRLLEYFLHNADHADRLIYPHRTRAARSATVPELCDPPAGSSSEPQKWLESEWRNILSAVEYGAKHEWKQQCAELAHIMAEFLDVRGCWDEAIRIHSVALHACRDLADHSGVARASIDLSLVSQHKGRHKSALQHASEALRIYDAIHDRRGKALAADRLAMVHFHYGKFRQALAYDQEAQALYVESRDQGGEAEATFHAGASCLNLGRLSESMEYLRIALILFERMGNLRGKAKTINSMAEIARRQGYHREALDKYIEALTIYQSMESHLEQATVTQNIGSIYLYKGDPEKAIIEFRKALATYRGSRDLLRQARAMCDIGDAFITMELFDESLIHHQNAASIAEQLGDQYVRVIALRGMAHAYRGTDCLDKAMKFYNDALRTAYKIEDPYEQAKILDGIAETMFRSGELDKGRIYLRQAHDLYRMTGSAEARTTELRLEVLDTPDGSRPYE
jgi:DNA-binding SARP family transcriptional activator/tetratricopeptide (TPR) repeat protein